MEGDVGKAIAKGRKEKGKMTDEPAKPGIQNERGTSVAMRDDC